VSVRNQNPFAIHGRLAGRTTKRVTVSRRRVVRLKRKSFSVAARGRKTVKLALPRPLRQVLQRRRKVSLRLTAKVTDPAGNTRTVKKKVTPKLKRRR
jgi:hypothetical protein